MKVYFIGAGPGDIELLTVKAINVIKIADVIIYAGSLVNPEILKFAKNDAKIYDSSRMTLEEIFDTILKGDIVARIHSGDPCVYSAIQEQMDWCETQGIEYEVIPGVSSFTAAAASLKQELTLPEVSQTVILTRIPGRTKVPDNEHMAQLAKIGATMVIFLSVHRIDNVVEELKQGYPECTPIAVVEKASMHDEKKIVGTLKDIVQKVKEVGISRQAVIIVGNVLTKKDYPKSMLYNKTFEHGFRRKTNTESVG
jgi:precorrin-4/cobalt-precorrin-4 C11-methyltransferase